jgi:hypothetical protein
MAVESNQDELQQKLKQIRLELASAFVKSKELVTESRRLREEARRLGVWKYQGSRAAFSGDGGPG